MRSRPWRVMDAKRLWQNDSPGFAIAWLYGGGAAVETSSVVEGRRFGQVGHFGGGIFVKPDFLLGTDANDRGFIGKQASIATTFEKLALSWGIMSAIETGSLSIVRL